MKFWDASAVVPLLVAQGESGKVRDWVARDLDVVVWWGTRVECVSSLARLEREGAAPATRLAAAFKRLAVLSEAWREIAPSSLVRETAVRLLRVHPLRAADSLQLAAALVAANDEPGSLPFVTFDERLADAARREGFEILA